MYTEDNDGIIVSAENWWPSVLPYRKDDRPIVVDFQKGSGIALNTFVGGKAVSDFNEKMTASFISSAQPKQSPVASTEFQISAFDFNLYAGVIDGSAKKYREEINQSFPEWKSGNPINFSEVQNTTGNEWQYDLAWRAKDVSLWLSILHLLLVPFFALRYLYLYARSDKESKPSPLIWIYILLLTAALFAPAQQLFR